MTVSTSTNSVVARGNGATTDFTVPFKVLNEDHLVVTRRDFATGELLYTYTGTDFTYAGIGDDSGTLTLAGAALDDDFELVIERLVPYTQDLDIVNAGGFYPETVEEQLDLIIMGVQQVADMAARGIVVPVGETGQALPSATDRTGKFFGFGAGGRFVALSGTGSDAGLREDLADADTGPDLVGFRQSTVGEKLLRSIDLVDEGVSASAINNDAAIAAAFIAFAGDGIRLPKGSFVSRSRHDLLASTMLYGVGPGSILRTDQASNHILYIGTDDVEVRDLALVGVDGATLHTNAGLVIDGAARSKATGLDISGMSGSGVWATQGASYGRIAGCHIHGLANDFINSSAVELYNDATNFDVVGNNFDATGDDTQVGVLCQTTSTGHNISDNRIKGYRAYAIIDYDNTPRATYNRIINNQISDIDGTEPGGSGGAGIYTVGTGGQIIAGNTTTNCNIGTLNESLAPGGIGISQAFSPVLLSHNYHHHNNWYGLIVVVTSEIVSSIGEVFVENTKDQIFIKASDNAHVVGASITALTVGAAVRCVNWNVIAPADIATQKGGVLVGTRSRGGGATARALEFHRVDDMLVVGNSHSDCVGSGAYFYGGAAANVSVGNVISGNIFDVSGGNNIALTLNGITYSVIDNLVLKTGGAIALQILGTSTGLRIGKNVAIYASGAWQAEPLNFIDNQSPGCILEAYGTKAPDVAGLHHQKGTRVINSNPTVGQPKAWSCSTAGIIGSTCVFTSEGNL